VRSERQLDPRGVVHPEIDGPRRVVISVHHNFWYVAAEYHELSLDLGSEACNELSHFDGSEPHGLASP